MTDRDLAWLISIIGVFAWAYVALRGGVHMAVPAWLLMLLSLGLFLVSTITRIDGIAPWAGVFIAANRAAVASAGVLFAWRIHRLRGARRGVPDER